MASTLLSSRHRQCLLPLRTSSVAPRSFSPPSLALFFRGEIQTGFATLRCFSPEGMKESPLVLERDCLGGASSSWECLEGFRKGLGSSGRPQRGKKAKSSGSYGDRAQIRAMAGTRGGSPFRKKREEDEDGESKNISLPIIGELPLTREDLSSFTPMKVFVWLVIATVLYSAWGALSSRTLYSPLFWMYSSWILVKWPWPAAISVGIITLITAFRCSKRQPNEWEQVLLLLGSLTWLILVPVGWFQGFVDGWPLILFALYVGFFLISSIVRYRLHGDLGSKDNDKQWETVPSRIWQIGFVVCVVAGHWLAAYEAPFLLYAWDLSWRSILAIATLAVAVVTHYFASYFLGKYFDRLVKPRAVVMFGPYRVVRHPIYASYMLLFAGYCLALRSYRTCLFLLAACIAYYEQRTRLEEDMLVDTFGQLYEDYRERVANKYFPLLY